MNGRAKAAIMKAAAADPRIGEVQEQDGELILHLAGGFVYRAGNEELSTIVPMTIGAFHRDMAQVVQVTKGKPSPGGFRNQEEIDLYWKHRDHLFSSRAWI